MGGRFASAAISWSYRFFGSVTIVSGLLGLEAVDSAERSSLVCSALDFSKHQNVKWARS